MPVIIATWEAEIRRIVVRDQPGQIVQETPIYKISRAKRTEGVAQAVERLLCRNKEFKPQSHQKGGKES
jgi:hypothetical protein